MINIYITFNYLDEFTNKLDCIVLTKIRKVSNMEVVRLPVYDFIYNNGDYNQNNGVVCCVPFSTEYFSDMVKLGNHKVIPNNGFKILLYKIYSDFFLHTSQL